MGANYSEIQELLKQRADIQARLNLMPYDGNPEIKEVSGAKYLYMRKRVAGKLTSTYVDVYSDELYQLLLRNAKERKDLNKGIRKINKDLTALGYEDKELSARVLQNLDFARANMKNNIYDQAVLEGVATSFPQTEVIIDNGKVHGVTATDAEDGNITKNIKVIENTVNKDKVGTYKVTYQITDSQNAITSKTITVIVTENKKPVITANDIKVKEQQEYNELKDVKATDEEDGDITKNVKVIENTTDTTKPGNYKITYEVSDSYNQKTTKSVTVTVLEDKKPIINAEDKTITQGLTFNELKDVTATDEEDGNLTDKIKIKENDKDRSFILYKSDYRFLFGIGIGNDISIDKKNVVWYTL